MGKKGYLYFGIGSALVLASDLRKIDIKDFKNKISNGENPEPININDLGSLSAEDYRTNLSNFKPIGIGKPLTIRIKQVYTGNLPSPNYIQKVMEIKPTRSMLLTSAIKSYFTFDAQPRAVNAIIPGVGQRKSIYPGEPLYPGTPIVYYSPAARDKSISLQIEMKFQEIDQKVFDIIGSTMTSAGSMAAFSGVPPFQVASIGLISLGKLVPLAAKFAKGLFTDKSQFSTSVQLSFKLGGGSEDLQPGFALLTHNALDSKLLKSLWIDGKEDVLDSNGHRYTGNVPFVVIVIDGTDDTNLSKFRSTAASAVLLDRFYNENAAENISEALIEAVKIYSDYGMLVEYHRITELQKSDISDSERRTLERERQTIWKHIQDSTFDSVLARSAGVKKPRKGKKAAAELREVNDPKLKLITQPTTKKKPSVNKTISKIAAKPARKSNRN